ncbi:MAG: hypothetical protein WCW68_02105 [Methanothrix sp.]
MSDLTYVGFSVPCSLYHDHSARESLGICTGKEGRPDFSSFLMMKNGSGAARHFRIMCWLFKSLDSALNGTFNFHLTLDILGCQNIMVKNDA